MLGMAQSGEQPSAAEVCLHFADLIKRGADLDEIEVALRRQAEAGAADVITRELNSSFSIKVLEVRDSGTFIPVVAVCCNAPWAEGSPDDQAWWLLRKVGFPLQEPLIFVMRVAGADFQTNWQPHEWSISGVRTLHVAHQHMIENWHKLENGGVVDVEYILGETAQPKISDRHA
jgi:hypothetical protein